MKVGRRQGYAAFSTSSSSLVCLSNKCETDVSSQRMSDMTELFEAAMKHFVWKMLKVVSPLCSRWEMRETGIANLALEEYDFDFDNWFSSVSF